MALAPKLRPKVKSVYEPCHEKTCFSHTKPTKVQISLRIHTVWSAPLLLYYIILDSMDRVKRIWYLLPMRAGKVQASLRIRAVSPEPSLLAHTSSESRGTFRQKARSLAPLNGWACAVKICHDGMLEDTNSLDRARILVEYHQLPYPKFQDSSLSCLCSWAGLFESYLVENPKDRFSRDKTHIG